LNMATASLPSTSIPSVIAQRLRALRTRITVWFLIDGLSKVLLTLVVLIGLDFLIDRTFHMDRAQRGVMLVLGVGCLGYVAYRWLLRPLAYHLSDDSLCLQVEHHYAELDDSLISAVQFARMSELDPGRISPAMVRATIDQGIDRASRVNFAHVLRSDRLVLNSAVLLSMIVLLSLLGVASASTDTMRIWLDRNILLGDSNWPQDYYFHVAGADNGQIRIPRGDDWPLLATVTMNQDRPQAKPPADAYLELQSGSNYRREKMEKGSEPLSFRFELPKVIEPFRFRLSAGRVTTSWFEAELIDRPEVKDLQLMVTPPGYAGGDPKPLPPGRGPYYLLQGSSLALSGTATKPLSRATISLGEEKQNLELEGERDFSLELSAQDVKQGTYEIELFDTSSLWLPGREDAGPLGSRRPTRFTVRTKLDRAPQVKARLEGISSMVVPGAKIPGLVSVRDDFAVTSAKLSYQWNSDSSATPPTEGEIGMEVADQLGSDRVDFLYEFELSPLEIPPGSALRFRFEATDNDDVSGPKVGQSTEFLLRVVSTGDLLEELLRREKEQRQEFQRLRDEQDKVATDSEAILRLIEGRQPMPDEQRLAVMKLEKRQKLLSSNVAAVAMRLAAIIQELQNNRLDEDGSRQERLVGEIIEPMNSLASEQMPSALEQLDSTRHADEVPERDTALEQAVATQRAVVEKMDQILLAMVQSEGFQEIVNQLYEIEKSQEEVFRHTEPEHLQTIAAQLAIPEDPPPEKDAAAEDEKTDDETGREKREPAQPSSAESGTAR